MAIPPGSEERSTEETVEQSGVLAGEPCGNLANITTVLHGTDHFGRESPYVGFRVVPYRAECVGSPERDERRNHEKVQSVCTRIGLTRGVDHRCKRRARLVPR